MNVAVLIPLLVAVGLVAGFASGLLGIGGGVLMVPSLVLAAGMSQHEAEATSLLVVVPTAIAGSIVLRRRGVGDLGAALRIGAFGVVGGIAGASLALALRPGALSTVFAVFVAIVGVRMIREAVSVQ
jgi:uncharacterized membrane protein YfcA